MLSQIILKLNFLNIRNQLSKLIMGNASKAIYSKQEYLYYHINRQQYSKIDAILDKNPQLLQKPITKDTKYTLLMRAVFTTNLESIKYVISRGANVNATTPKGQTALAIAVKKKQLSIVQKLVQSGADINFTHNQLSIIDLAILPGYFEIASYLYSKMKSKQHKQPQQYELIAKKYSYRYVNYQQFLQSIKGNLDHEAFNEDYLIKSKVKIEDPVPDPRQSWKQWIKRTAEFKDPPMVQRDSLPADLQPQNRGVLGKADIFLTNWTRSDIRKKSTIRPKRSKEVMSQMGDLYSKKLVSNQDYASVS